MTEFYELIEYIPRYKDLFVTALTHSSCGLKYNNEKLEFLGDSVLQLITSEFLYNTFIDMNEGELSKLRSELVCENALYEWALHVNLGKFINLGKGEQISNGRNKPSILADAVEAVIAAVYLDGGYIAAKKLSINIIRFLLDLKNKGLLFADSKTSLQELLQKDGGALPVYTLLSTEGPAHSRVFKMSVSYNNRVLATGIGASKKQAEQNAARNAIIELNK